MKILSFGSLNYDYVYRTPHFTAPKETQTSSGFSRGFGGKGFNQSVALAKAGADVFHAGKVGADGQPFIDYLQNLGVKTDFLVTDGSVSTGHAVIEVSGGENRILLYPGANRRVDENQVDETLKSFGSGDFLLIQNEISCIPYLIQSAREKGMFIFFNAAPMDESVFDCPLECADVICVNEIEGKSLAGAEDSDIPSIGRALSRRFPGSGILLTAGKDGSMYFRGDEEYFEPARIVTAVDTTAAGDTYIGYYLTALSSGLGIREAMSVATGAAAFAVQRPGAAASIPFRSEL